MTVEPDRVWVRLGRTAEGILYAAPLGTPAQYLEEQGIPVVVVCPDCGTVVPVGSDDGPRR